MVYVYETGTLPKYDSEFKRQESLASDTGNATTHVVVVVVPATRVGSPLGSQSRSTDESVVFREVVREGVRMSNCRES